MFDALRGRIPRLGRWPRLALAACCVLLALDSAASARSAATSPAHRSEIAVVVAARDLPAGHRLAGRDVAIIRLPAGSVPGSANRRVRDVLGRRLSGPLARHEAVTRARLLGHDLTTGLARGLVAVPVELADPHAADLLHAGDFVDLLATPRAEAEAGLGSRTSAADVTVVGRHLLILAVVRGDSSDAADVAAGTELVVAMNSDEAVRITRVSSAQTLAGVGVPP